MCLSFISSSFHIFKRSLTPGITRRHPTPLRPSQGVPVLNFEDFEAKFAQLKNKRKLFGFLLYDSRPTNQVVEKFTQERYNWLDELAGFGKIYFFFPLRKAAPKIFENPSLEVAKFFNLDAGKLPGILLFTGFSSTESRRS